MQPEAGAAADGMEGVVVVGEAEGGGLLEVDLPAAKKAPPPGLLRPWPTCHSPGLVSATTEGKAGC